MMGGEGVEGEVTTIAEAPSAAEPISCTSRNPIQPLRAVMDEPSALPLTQDLRPPTTTPRVPPSKSVGFPSQTGGEGEGRAGGPSVLTLSLGEMKRPSRPTSSRRSRPSSGASRRGEPTPRTCYRPCLPPDGRGLEVRAGEGGGEGREEDGGGAERRGAELRGGEEMGGEGMPPGAEVLLCGVAIKPRLDPVAAAKETLDSHLQAKEATRQQWQAADEAMESVLVAKQSQAAITLPLALALVLTISTTSL